MLGAIGLLLCVKLFVFSDRTLPIEGVVTDARTGKPIAKVIVTADWDMHAPFMVGWGRSHRTVTDEQGRFRVPGKLLPTLLSKFDFQSLHCYHPLYDFANKMVFTKRYGGYREGKIERGRLQVTLQMQALEDRFSKPEDNSELATFFSAITPEYFLQLRDKYGVRYDLKEVLAKWEHLATRYPQGNHKHGYEAIQLYFPRLRFQMEKIMSRY